MVSRRLVPVPVAVLAAALAASPAEAQAAKAELRNARGEAVGTATLTQEANAVAIAAQVSKLPPGFHGFHVHAVGRCDPPEFTSAGGHLNPAGQAHPGHAGDLPNLLVLADGTGAITVRTDRFRVDDLFDADGSAIIVHANPDNHANIPERYQPRPDAATLATGDAGGRLACGAIAR